MLDERQGLYIISVAARLLAMHPQTLRKYERAGFLTPNRTGGMLRLYSEEDIQRLQLIKHLVDELGLNLAGVEMGLALAKLLQGLQQAAEETKDPVELRVRMREGLQEALDLLRKDSPPAEPEQRAPQQRRETRVRITHYGV
jgi:MerR family transcriptional regulator/heat shock protein HspR